MHVVFYVALSGFLPSPTQMAPNNRELNKYEANKGEVRVRRHEFVPFFTDSFRVLVWYGRAVDLSTSGAPVSCHHPASSR